MQIAKKLLIFALLLVMLTSVNALDYSVYKHTITIIIGDTTDSAVEKFYISFPSEAEKIAFREKSLELGTNLEEWSKINSAFVPNLGQNTSKKKIGYTEGEQNYLQISYDLTETLMAKGKEATMVTEYTMKVSYFNLFYQAGLWIIPDNTEINIELPPGAEIRDIIEPQANVTRNVARQVVSWQGYKSGSKLSLNYILWKKIDPVFDLNGMLNFITKTTEGNIIGALIILIIIGIIWQRKKISRAIEEFVETNSLIQEE